LEVPRSVGNLSISSLGIILHSWWFFPLFRVGKEDELQIGDGDANERHNWSMEQLPRTLGEGLHILFGFHFFPISSICKT